MCLNIKIRPVTVKLFYAEGRDKANSRFPLFCESAWKQEFTVFSLFTSTFAK